MGIIGDLVCIWETPGLYGRVGIVEKGHCKIENCNTDAVI